MKNTPQEHELLILIQRQLVYKIHCKKMDVVLQRMRKYFGEMSGHWHTMKEQHVIASFERKFQRRERTQIRKLQLLTRV